MRGYFRVYRPDYPRAWSSGYAKRYVIVWWLKTGQVVARGMNVHHKDADTLNDRFDNLELIEHAEHTRLHRTKPRPFIHCQNPACNTLFLLPKGKSIKTRRFCSLGCRCRARVQLSVRDVQRLVKAANRGVTRAALARQFKMSWYAVDHLLQELASCA